ncbi:Mu transposase domain-containing protein [Sandaracinus amylolyticus]|uniref:Mu transposase domain-containing protein n=1 Tax=Sandaracinus amylolyticus TaxID=927083 RepID=UPI003AF3D01A
MVPIASGKRPYVRFDTNDYSIPHELVGQPLTLVASDLEVRVLDGCARSRVIRAATTASRPSSIASTSTSSPPRSAPRASCAAAISCVEAARRPTHCSARSCRRASVRATRRGSFAARAPPAPDRLGRRT